MRPRARAVSAERVRRRRRRRRLGHARQLRVLELILDFPQPVRHADKRGDDVGDDHCGAAEEKEADAPQLLPFNLSAGEIAMFWGHRLKYGFVGRNETGHSVVGIDFHVVPWPLYKESRQDGKRSNHSLRLGSYYSVMDARGAEAAIS